MENYNSKDEYISAVKQRSKLPEGFSAGSCRITFFPVEKQLENPLPMKLNLIQLDAPTQAFAALFTKNSFPGAPVIIGRKRLEQKAVQGVFINNKISNVCTASGVSDAEELLAELAAKNGTEASMYFPSSTGIIGWKLPVQEMKAGLDALLASMNRESIFPAAEGIMTTDSFPKVRSAETADGLICGIAKGAGMIEPDMATMLAYILTDISMEKDELQKLLKEAADESFNTISIDSDQSTSDTVLALSSCRKKLTDRAAFREAFIKVCRELSSDIVRNGEGTAHVIRCTVEKAPDRQTALELGKFVINSPLVKTAVYGNDPNVGRIIMAVGDYLGKSAHKAIEDSIEIYMDNRLIFKNRSFLIDSSLEESLSAYMKDCMLDTAAGFPKHDRNVEIKIVMNAGRAAAAVYGSDLSYEYVKENADYRS